MKTLIEQIDSVKIVKRSSQMGDCLVIVDDEGDINCYISCENGVQDIAPNRTINITQQFTINNFDLRIKELEKAGIFDEFLNKFPQNEIQNWGSFYKKFRELIPEKQETGKYATPKITFWQRMFGVKP